MKNKLMKDVEMIGDALWLNYKGYDIRIEKTKQFNNNNLVITVTPKGKEDYTDRLIYLPQHKLIVLSLQKMEQNLQSLH